MVGVLWIEFAGVVDRFGVGSAHNNRKSPTGIILEHTIRFIFIPRSWIPGLDTWVWRKANQMADAENQG